MSSLYARIEHKDKVYFITSANAKPLLDCEDELVLTRYANFVIEPATNRLLKCRFDIEELVASHILRFKDRVVSLHDPAETLDKSL